MRRRWSYSKYSARRFGGRRYSRQRVGPGSKRSAYLKGTSWLCNVYATPSDFLEVNARESLTSRVTIIQRSLPSDPYTLRLNTGLTSFRGDMWRWRNAEDGSMYTSEGFQYLCNVCSGLGVSSAVINMRPPMNKWNLDVKMIYGADLPEYVALKRNGNPVLTSYSGANNVIQWGQYGQMYDRYFIDYIVFEYVPSCSRMTDGQVTLLWNDNPTDPIPSTMGQFLTNTRCITTQVYNKARLVVRPRRWLWTCPQAGNTGVRSFSVRNQNVTAIPFTDRMVDCGWFAVCARSSKPEYFSAGTIRVSYGVRFSKPSINLEFIQPTVQASADGTTVDGLQPAKELIQPAMPAVQRPPPANSLFLSSSNVNGRDVRYALESGPMGRADDDFPGIDVPQIDPNPQVGSLVMGGGGNPQTVDDQYGSNYKGNPMYYYADTCIGMGDGGGGGEGPDLPDEPDNPVVPDDPIPPPEPDIPSFAMASYAKMYGVPFYMGSGFVSPSNASIVKSYLSTYQAPSQGGSPGSEYGQSFMGENEHWPAGSSGATPVTPSTVVGFATMIDNDANMSSPKAGQVVSLFGPNCIYTQRDMDSSTRALTFSANKFIYFSGTSWNSGRLLKLLTGYQEAQFSGGPNQFYLAGEWDSQASPDITAANSVFSGLRHDFMFMFLSKFYAYGVTYYGPESGRDTRTWGVLRELSTNSFDYSSRGIGAGIASSFNFDCFVTSDIPLGNAGASKEPKGNFMAYNGVRVWSLLNPPSKLGMYVGIHLSFTRVAVPFLLQTRTYLACIAGTNGRDALLSLLGVDGSSNQTVTWPPVDSIGSVQVFSSDLNEQIIWPFSTYNGLGDQGPKDDLVALTTHGLSYSISFECDLSKLIGSGALSYAPSVMFHLGDAEHIGIDIPNYDGYSTDFETENLNTGTPQNVGGYFVAGAQFFIDQMQCVVYNPAHVPSGLSDAQLGQYLAANPSAVIMGSGM